MYYCRNLSSIWGNELDTLDSLTIKFKPNHTNFVTFKFFLNQQYGVDDMFDEMLMFTLYYMSITMYICFWKKLCYIVNIRSVKNGKCAICVLVSTTFPRFLLLYLRIYQLSEFDLLPFNFIFFLVTKDLCLFM